MRRNIVKIRPWQAPESKGKPASQPDSTAPPRLEILPIGQPHPAWHGLVETDLWPAGPLDYLDQPAPNLSTKLEAALAYAKLAWRGHPTHWIINGLCSCGDPACAIGLDNKAGKHPILTAWQDRATTSPDLIRRWWGRWPDANVAVPTGPKSGVFVFDVDGPAGERTLVDLEHDLGDMPERYVQQWTGGGRAGWQAVFSWPEGRSIGNSVSSLGLKLDVRGDRGSALLPPSITAQTYTWAEERDPWSLPLEPAPGWLLDLIDPPAAPEPERTAWSGIQTASRRDDRYLLRAIEAELALVASAPEGRRNDQLNEAAFNLFRFAVEGRIDAGAIAHGLEAAARHAGLDQREITATIKSAALKRGVQP